MSDASLVNFLPWMRRGFARALAAPADADGLPVSGLAEVEVAVDVNGTEVRRSVLLRGPESVIGLHPSQVLRSEPRDGTTDFETNYFPFVELVSPDLPWQFTPAAPLEGRLAPWLALVVVEDRPGVTLRSGGAGPLPVLAIEDGAARELPSLREAWAWAHVQVSRDIGAEGVNAAFVETPEAFVARMMCPRVLATGTWYRACLVPVFERGRQSGLGMTVSADATALSWTDATDRVELPVYHSSRFRTAAAAGDFESLVRKLVPRTLPSDVGVAELDIGDPGSPRLPRTPGTVVGFQGALVSPVLEVPVWPEDHRVAFQKGLRDLLDEATVSAGTPAGTAYDALRDDPVVAPPVYGQTASATRKVPAAGAPGDEQHPVWLREVNLDPALRAVAGLGAESVRRDQEALVASAWDQMGAIREVNRTLNRARLALEVGLRMKRRLDVMDEGTRLQVTRGAHPRLKGSGDGATLHGDILGSVLPDGLVSAAFRRRARPGTTVARAATSALPGERSGSLCAKLTTGFVMRPVEHLSFSVLGVPAGTVFSEDAPKDNPAAAVGHLARSRIRMNTSRASAGVSRAVGVPGAGAAPLSSLALIVADRMDPTALLAARVRSIVAAPAGAWGAERVPARMAFSPEYPSPLYAALVAIDPEYMMPGVGTIPEDTVALAKLNGAFVEAFLLGANDELRRELVWREVPIRLRDTWLRTFWNRGDDTPGDIGKVAAWNDAEALGLHAPAGGVDPARVLALLVKGALLRRYPDTLIYAVRALWQDGVRVEDRSAEPCWPTFFGSLGGDLVFLGIEFPADVDLDGDVAGDPREAANQPGWFFVFEQAPTQPRFGLDVGSPRRTSTGFAYWKNVSWYHAMATPDWSRTHCPIDPLRGVRKPFDVTDPSRDDENDWSETWGRDAAAQARITRQRPVRVLVHADQMLGAVDSEEVP